MLRKTLFASLIGCLICSSQTVAQKTDILFSNKFYGLVSAGLGTYFLIEANKARVDGDEAFELYKAAGSSTLARELYDESRENETKAAMILGLGVGTITYGIHLFMKGDRDKLPDPNMDRGLVVVKGVKIDAGADPRSGRMGLLLRRTF